MFPFFDSSRCFPSHHHFPPFFLTQPLFGQDYVIVPPSSVVWIVDSVVYPRGPFFVAECAVCDSFFGLFSLCPVGDVTMSLSPWIFGPVFRSDTLDFVFWLRRLLSFLTPPPIFPMKFAFSLLPGYVLSETDRSLFPFAAR